MGFAELPTTRPPTHFGEMLLKEFFDPLGMSQVEPTKQTNVPFQRLNPIVKRRRDVSADTALLFRALRQPGSFRLRPGIATTLSAAT